jgi:hypothetical protein
VSNALTLLNYRVIWLCGDTPETRRPIGPGISGRSELVISNGAYGFLAPYRYVAELDVMRVAAARRQSKLRYRRTNNTTAEDLFGAGQAALVSDAIRCTPHVRVDIINLWSLPFLQP